MTLKNWLAAEPFTLALSSSFFGFFVHAGIVAALEEARLRPAKVTGASAGALIAAAIASGLTTKQTRDLLFSVKREDFWDPSAGFGYLSGKKFAALLAKNFVAAFEDAKIPVELAVFDVFRLKTEFVGSGDFVSALHASCAVPMLFHPVKREGRWLVDGGALLKSAINPRDARTLCIYLETPGWTGTLERKLLARKLRDDQKVLSFHGLPRVNPLAMEAGPIAYESGYERMKLALETIEMPSGGSILEA